MERRSSRVLAEVTTCLACGILILAAVAKLLSAPRPTGLPLLDHELTRPIAAVVELLAAIWLVSGWNRKRASVAVGCLFFGFAGVAAWLALRGAPSCGCFGDLAVAPVGVAAVDVALGGLLLWQRSGSGRASWRLRAVGAAAVCAIACSVGPISLGVARETESGVVWIRPEEWVGRELPILGDVDAAVDFRRGEWTVVFYRSSCHDCLERVARYRELGRGGRVLFVALPPVPARDQFRERLGGGDFGVVRGHGKWFMKTPAAVRVVDGIVRAAG